MADSSNRTAESRRSIHDSSATQIQVSLMPNMSWPGPIAFGSLKETKRKRSLTWLDLMHDCLEYIKKRTEENNEPIASEVQHYMLGRWGTSRQRTSLILRDLSSIGKIGARGDLRIFAMSVHSRRRSVELLQRIGANTLVGSKR